jgi:uncharacterized protein (DUF2252 family)
MAMSSHLNVARSRISDRTPANGAADIPFQALLPEQTHTKTVEERLEIARSLRTRCPRKSQAGWKTPENRLDPIDTLMASSAGRISHLVPIRHGRMMQSPFAFYRGGAAVMAGDLAQTPSTGLHLQICGDCHLLNFGGFATPERRLVFDINDFDETSVGPWEWDVKRLAASCFIAAQSNGFDKDVAKEAAWCAASAYRDRMAEYSDMPILDAWYDYLDLKKIIEQIVDPAMKKIAKSRLKKATEYTAHTKEFVKLAVAEGFPPRIRDEPPLIYHDESSDAIKHHKELDRAFAKYRHTLQPRRRVLLDRFRIVDIAIKVVGVGSVGTYCGIMLMISGSGDPLFLQFKEARASVIEPYIGSSIYKHHGQRVVVGQRMMQSASDIFLGWTNGPTRQFYVRQLRDAKVSADVSVMKPTNLRNYAKLCGRALARAHARTGDAVILSAYLGKSDAYPDAIASFASDYADQNERDYDALIAAVRQGRVEAKVID